MEQYCDGCNRTHPLDRYISMSGNPTKRCRKCLDRQKVYDDAGRKRKRPSKTNAMATTDEWLRKRLI